MSNTTNARFICLTGLLLATAVLFPVIFHQFGIAGRIFLPMHIPVLLAGFLLGPLAGLLVGGLAPGLSSLVTGMPPTALAIPMTPELAAYGLVVGLLFTGSRRSLWLALIGALIAGRFVWFLLVIVISPLLGFEGRALIVALAAQAVGWPGVLILFIFVPPLVMKMRRSLVRY